MERIVVIDRFEESIVICEDRNSGEIIEVKREEIPTNANEGTVLVYKDGKYEVDIQEQEKIEERIKRKMDDLWS